MQEIRNSMDKLVCMLDKSQKIIEIILKGCKTTIQFLDNGAIKITNATIVV